MRNEAVVPNRDQIADERVGLNPASFADGCSLLDLNERSDEGIVADVTAVKFVGSMTVTFAPNFTSTNPTVRCLTGFISQNSTNDLAVQRSRALEDRNDSSRVDSPVSGSRELRMQSAKCSASTRSGSANLTSGMRMSPLR